MSLDQYYKDSSYYSSFSGDDECLKSQYNQSSNKRTKKKMTFLWSLWCGEIEETSEFQQNYLQEISWQFLQ